MKYPRTYHLPFSPGATKDDKILHDLSALEGKPVVVTVKMDGECTSMYSNKIHARSEDSKDHPSRHWVKGFHASIKAFIPDNIILCGENLYAKHSIHYTNLEDYFYLFSTWDKEHEHCLDWEHTKALAMELNITLVPILYEGIFDLSVLEKLATKEYYFGDEMEGFVVRTTAGFGKEDFCKCVAKYVRKDHVQTDEHWLYRELIKNERRKQWV